ncbi:SDR family NAD(P)-dependent oxidoreductase [Pseudorhodoplanes sinuspersici]|uniref:NADP-dependent 3-hydroxy acid dehydrogenase YdfG n=1 Tax=Pseudorhodoplanes sinuspersici TaxID=1235591 RepID=A0A1W6ZXJ6_9HYPH|nr:SDR family oxidoreductase [Pseudorhodoplanes sinuspersici]ARQ02050.1 SDR family oxidoreductase [Pseudorhodoplanes sinuspersici]RKE73843.1 hypothetical protein DFP91_1739 [Pseudorhodoplanes sinuspersici]
MATNPSTGTALITGASAGIGAIYADRLARRGYDLILVARNEARLRAVADKAAANTGRHVQTVIADLGKKNDLLRVEKILRDDPSITMMVNNAGFASVQPLLNENVDRMEDMIALNVTALTRLAYAAAPGFVARGKGTIINISSIVGISVETLNGVYGASKAYVLALSHSLQHELAGKGVRVQAVLPGATATEIWENAGVQLSSLPKEIVMSADEMVDAALAGLDQGETVTIPSLQDGSEWTRYEEARRALSSRLSTDHAAPRYRAA